MLFTVVIPVYNVEDYLKECLESVIAQTYKNLEVILVNDGSTDQSAMICKEYCNLYDNFKYIEKLNGGLSDARNHGINASSGEYIIFLDSDDFWEANFLEEIASVVEKERPDMLFFKLKYYYPAIIKDNNYLFKNKDIKNLHGEKCLNHILSHHPTYAWWACMNIVKKELILNESLFFELGRLYEDAMWTPQVFLCSKKIYFYDKAIYMYRQGREGQNTSLINKKMIEDNVYVVKYWEDKLTSKYIDINSQLKVKLMNNIAIRYFISIAFVGFLEGDIYKQSIEILKENKKMLNYRFNFFTKSIYYMCVIFGFRRTSTIIKRMIIWKRKLNKM